MAGAINHSSQDADIGLLDVALLIAENLKLLILIPLTFAVIALAVTFTLSPTYTATTRILPPQQPQTSAALLFAAQWTSLSGGMTSALGLKNPADVYIGILKSRTVADRLLDRFNLQKLYDEQYSDEARKELAKLTTITLGKDGLITIEVDDHDPKRAAEMANAYVEALYHLTQSLAVTEAAQRRLFFEKQLQRTKDDLARSEIALRGSGINEAALKTVPQSTIEALARLKAQITAQEVKLAAMQGFMTESNPEYRQAQQELAALHAQLAKAQRIDLSKATGAGAEYIEKFRTFKYHETLFELVAKQYEVARLDEAREGAVIQVVDLAVPPERKSKPKRSLIVFLTTSVSLALTLLFVFLRQAVGKAASHPESAGKLLRLRQLLRLLGQR